MLCPKRVGIKVGKHSRLLSKRETILALTLGKKADLMKCLNMKLEAREHVRDLRLRYANINDLDRPKKASRLQKMNRSCPLNRLNIRWSESNELDVTNLPATFFFQQDHDGDTILHLAISMKLREASLWLIERAPHPKLVDIRNDDFQSALHLAVMYREPQIVRRLVLAGADIQLRTREGNTALHLACNIGDLDCLKALTDPLSPLERLEFGDVVIKYELELRNYVGKTCLHLAASSNLVNLVYHLLRCGASTSTREALCGMTALHLAVDGSCHEVIRLLVRDSPECLDVLTYGGVSAYEMALDKFQIPLANELFDSGMRASQRGKINNEKSNNPFPCHVRAFSKVNMETRAVTA